MIRLIEKGVYLFNGNALVEDVEKKGLTAVNEEIQAAGMKPLERLPEDRESAAGGTIAANIIAAHNVSGTKNNYRIRFDSLASHDITYVGIIQTAIASGMKRFPIPYVMTNCHNSLCAVGGTINEDDHLFGLSAAKRYGGEFVPAHLAVIHSYVREMMSGCGRMILGSDSHTRYGALGTMGVGEGGPELVKQLVGRTYDFPRADVVAVYLTGAPRPGIGPQDVALAIIGAVFKNGFVKNKVMEFVGPGVSNLPVEFRSGIDVMTTETACWTSVWRTDERVEEYFHIHGRPEAYKRLEPAAAAWYDAAIVVELDKVKPMIALPFHPSNVYTIEELNANPYEILKRVEEDARSKLENPELKLNLTEKISKEGKIRVDQGIIAGCSGGTFDNVVAAAQILRGGSVGNGEFSLSVYPGSQPAMLELIGNGSVGALMEAGAVVKTAFCGPCFGAGDTPSNHGFSIRHTTRNFPNREGSKPGEGQISSVALMDARSIAATAANGGVLTSAERYGELLHDEPYKFRGDLYEKKVYHGFGKADDSQELIYGPNIRPWPKVYPLADNLLLKMASVITDPVTTTDELIPSGETSSLRSNPLKLAEFALSRKDPLYVGRAKAAQALEDDRRAAVEGGVPVRGEAEKLLVSAGMADSAAQTAIGSVIFAVKPGDGSAREQAASSQRVLGGQANFAEEYATKRYRSNLINWGMIPFITDSADRDKFKAGEWLLILDIRAAIESGAEEVGARLIGPGGEGKKISLKMPGLTKDDRAIILAGCLMNFYANENK
ncbi:hydratase [Cloacibacillus porcorum]|uniref:Hydratase n=1 Tax=Cloacibacillus porcorum TaxID=1197717 RepID=A0A1B2I2K6_9BACT|nr:hydratase [Cloacibacillus porcorum]ANZ44177.1 hydratase [Cloacibacillus porcorum]